MKEKNKRTKENRIFIDMTTIMKPIPLPLCIITPAMILKIERDPIILRIITPTIAIMINQLDETDTKGSVDSRPPLDKAITMIRNVIAKMVKIIDITP
jgi:hypothetical protein